LFNSTLTVFTTAFGIWYLCAAADRHNDPVTLRETTSTLAVPPITRAPRHHAHHRRWPRGPPPYLRRFRWRLCQDDDNDKPTPRVCVHRRMVSGTPMTGLREVLATLVIIVRTRHTVALRRDKIRYDTMRRQRSILKFYQNIIRILLFNYLRVCIIPTCITVRAKKSKNSNTFSPGYESWRPKLVIGFFLCVRVCTYCGWVFLYASMPVLSCNCMCDRSSENKKLFTSVLHCTRGRLAFRRLRAVCVIVTWSRGRRARSASVGRGIPWHPSKIPRVRVTHGRRIPTKNPRSHPPKRQYTTLFRMYKYVYEICLHRQ
jgi:hypothetical protein